MKMKIRQNDTVVVIAGDDKGTIAKVLRVLPEENKLVVEGVNRVFKHLRPSAKNQKGGRLSKEMPIHASNVMLYSQTAKHGVRVGTRIDPKTGQKERYCKKTKAALGTIGPAKSERAASPAN